MESTKKSILWPISGYTIMIWIVDELMRNSYLMKLLKLSLFKLTRNKKYRFNITVSVLNPTRFCNEFLVCDKENINASIRWIKTFRDPIICQLSPSIDFDLLESDEPIDIYLFISMAFLYKFVDENYWLDKIAHLKSKACIHLRLIISENDFSESDLSGIETLKGISKLTFGTFAIVRICSSVKTCSSGCNTWLIVNKTHDRNQVKMPDQSQVIQIHMKSFINSSQSIILPCGKTYILNNSKEHESVLMKPTLSASSDFTYKYFRPNTCQNSFIPFDCCIHPHLWSRVSVNEKLVNDLNRRIYESAKEEADSRKCLFNWSTKNSSQISDLLDGQSVLARRLADGHYYLGTIQKVKGHLPVDQVLVQFGPIHTLSNMSLRKCPSDKSDSDIFDYEWIDITDVIDLKHNIKNTIEPGDCVLIPNMWSLPKCAVLNKIKLCSLENLRYYPATVVSCRDQRGENLIDTENSSENEQKLWVELANSNTRVGCIYVPKHKAVWIPQNTYQRIILEQHMPPQCRKWLKNKTFLPNTYPFQSAPGYPADGFSKFKSCKSGLKSDIHIQPLTFQQFRHGTDVQFEYCPSLQCWPLYSVLNDLLPVVDGCSVWCDNQTSNNESVKVATSKLSNSKMQSIEPNCGGNSEPKLVYRSRGKPQK
ncbi:von Willebrand factor A domain-containing 3B [Schistosoma japonicum]|uniref:von Willebrand factor A domain-containing 3B n=1 Tax=Schistosoma japonicum TaxID=6182 RepID=A0A4Z2CNX2_SCHJA|nr:von Willebrand factor A domain-containing 3B [Schistosoma japonicum]